MKSGNPHQSTGVVPESGLVPPEPQPVVAGVHRIEQLDSLRGLAALNVFFAHCFPLYAVVTPTMHLWLVLMPTRLLGDGHPAVLFFFLLSGFVLYLPFTKPGTPPYGPYLVRRVCRIYIPYVVAIAFTAITCQIFSHPLANINPAAFTWHRLSAHEFARQFSLFLSCILPFYRSGWNGAMWSIAEEMRISLFFPLLALGVRRLHWRWSLLAALLTSLACAEAVRVSQHFFPFMTFHYAGIFVVGATLAKYKSPLCVWARKLHSFYWLAALIAITLAAYASTLAALGPATFSEELSDLAVTVGNSLILLTALESARLCAFLRLAPVLALGRVSYSFYLYFQPALFIAACVLWTRVPNPVVFLIGLIGTALLALTSYRWVELPSIALGRRLTGHPLRTHPGHPLRTHP